MLTHTKQCAEYSANSSPARQLQSAHERLYNRMRVRYAVCGMQLGCTRSPRISCKWCMEEVQSNVNHEIERSRHNTHCILSHVAMCSCGCGRHQLGCTRSPRISCKWCTRCKATKDVPDTCNTIAYFLMLPCACSCGFGQHHNTIEQASSQAHTDKPKLSELNAACCVSARGCG